MPIGIDAHAACLGGSGLKGKFGVLINGPVASGASEMYTGLLTGDGKCGLTGSLIGGVSGSPATTSAVTGHYSVPSNTLGSMSLTVAGLSNPLTFTISTASGSGLVGIQTDGSAVATINLSKVTAGTHTNKSLHGTYVDNCYGQTTNSSSGVSSPSVETDLVTFDGIGVIIGTGSGIVDGVLSSNFKIIAPYHVNGNGTLTSNLNSNFPNFGVLVSGNEIYVLETSTQSNELGPGLTCIMRKQ
jgi:hypothetical protein